MELRRYLLLLRQRLTLVVLTVVAGLAGGYLVTNNTPLYRSQTSIYVGSRALAAGQLTPEALASMDRITQTFAAMIKSSPVAQGAIQSSHAPRSPEQAVGETSAAVVPNTNLISISVTDTDPVVAQAIANGVAQSFIAQVQNFNPSTSLGATSASVFQQANLPGAPIPTTLKRNLALGGLFGLFVSVAVILVVDYLDISIKSAEDLERHSGLPVLGTIPLRRYISTDALTVLPQPQPISASRERE